jgi:hypothetical protein
MSSSILSAALEPQISQTTHVAGLTSSQSGQMGANGDLASLFGDDDMEELFGREDSAELVFGNDDSDMKSLFGDGGDDDLDSLFGDHNHISSPFMEEEGEPTSRNDFEEPVLESTSPGNQLTLPTNPDQSHDTGALTLPILPSQPVESQLTMPTPPPGSSPTNADAAPAADALSLNPQVLLSKPSQDAGSFNLTVPASPDPPVTPLCNQAGHTSGNAVVSTHNIEEIASSPMDDPEVNNGLEAILDVPCLKRWARSEQKQDLAAQHERASLPQDEAIAQWHAQRLRKSQELSLQPQRLPLPPRIDTSPQLMTALTPFVSMSKWPLFPITGGLY